MSKELQPAKEREEQSTRSAIAEMNMAILAEVSTLEIVMQRLYVRFVTVDNIVFHLHGHQQCCTKIA